MVPGTNSSETLRPGFTHLLQVNLARQCLRMYGGEIHTTNMDMQNLVVIALPLLNCGYFQAHEK